MIRTMRLLVTSSGESSRMKSPHRRTPFAHLLAPMESVMSLDNLQSLFENELKDIYNAEKQLVDALPRIAKAASSPELADAISKHLEETKGHVQRIEQIMRSLDMPTRGKKCKGMEGLLAEGKEILEEDGEDAVRDAGIISAAQRVEHYEIAAYGCLRTYAETLGHTEAAHLLDRTLEEEEAADQKLNSLAEGGINQAAATASTTE
jgi:ferritin-like metal-binding protein YciE